MCAGLLGAMRVGLFVLGFHLPGRALLPEAPDLATVENPSTREEVLRERL